MYRKFAYWSILLLNSWISLHLRQPYLMIYLIHQKAKWAPNYVDFTYAKSIKSAVLFRFRRLGTSTFRWLGTLKVPGLTFQNGDFHLSNASPPKKSWFQISVKSVKRFECMKRLCILQLPIHCVSLYNMVTITSHIFIIIFQTVHFSAVRFTMGN